jgi:rare lipoprotein A
MRHWITLGVGTLLAGAATGCATETSSDEPRYAPNAIVLHPAAPATRPTAIATPPAPPTTRPIVKLTAQPLPTRSAPRIKPKPMPMPRQAQVVVINKPNPELWDGQGKCEGDASFYAGQFIGRRTANGERYTGRKLTAAHRVLPFGTCVKVTNLDNGLDVIVRINDRGPFIPGRIIDLSPAAAKKLHMIKEGVVRVKLEIVAPWMAEL